MRCASDAFLPHAPWQTLDFEEFCALVKEREVGSHSTYALEQRFKALDANDSGRIEMHEYLMFSLRDALARSITRVIELLQSWDSDKSGDISKKEFRKAVRALGFSDARDREVDAVFDEIDDDGSGRVDYKELNRKIREMAGVAAVGKHKLRRGKAGGRKGAALGSSVKLDTSAGLSAAAMAAELRQVLFKNAVRVIDLFRDWDEDGDGTVSKAEFGKIMPLLGVEAPPEAISALFDSFDPDGSGTIEYQELSQILTRGGRKARNYTPGMVLLPVTKQRVHVARPGERLGQDKSFFKRSLQPMGKSPPGSLGARMRCELPPVPAPPPPPPMWAGGASRLLGAGFADGTQTFAEPLDRGLRHRLARLESPPPPPPAVSGVVSLPSLVPDPARRPPPLIPLGFSHSISLTEIKRQWRRKPPTPCKAARRPHVAGSSHVQRGGASSWEDELAGASPMPSPLPPARPAEELTRRSRPSPSPGRRVRVGGDAAEAAAVVELETRTLVGAAVAGAVEAVVDTMEAAERAQRAHAAAEEARAARAAQEAQAAQAAAAAAAEAAWASSPGGRQVVQAAEAGRAAAKRARSIAAGLNTTPNRTGNLRSPRAGGLSSKGKGGAAARTRVTGMRMETVSVPVS